ncbi:MAG: protein kinase [Myxococcota bacterium]
MLEDTRKELDRTGPLVPETSAAVGDRLGDYVIECRIGAGGMGEVFAARHAQTGEQVALKTLSTNVARRLYRFKREFRALADVPHPNLVSLYELVIPEQGVAFYTMELLHDAVPFVHWIRDDREAGCLPNLDRLNECMRQLVEGIEHIHAHDCIHRDLKPANVLVTTTGRVVVLDLGLVSELSEPGMGVTREGQVLGTPSYMAPEQAVSLPLGPPADLYSVGVMLFEGVTGQRPPNAMQRLLDESAEEPPDPKTYVTGVPEPLRALCKQLLARKPEDRPSATQVLERLAGNTGRAMARKEIFVGREHELAVLHECFATLAAEQTPVTVHLRGASGNGKSRLCQQFRRQVMALDATVLHSRCRPQETIPYKGMDGVIDALSGYLRRLPQTERQSLQPPYHDVLVRLFPVLDEIWLALPIHRRIEAAELRRLGSFTLKDLFRRLGRVRPLLVHIDDMQWADLDTVKLLEQIVGGDESDGRQSDGRPAMVLLLSYRDSAEEVQRSEALKTLLSSKYLTGPSARILGLDALPFEDARAMAEALLPAEKIVEVQAVEARAEAIAMRAKGSPFFISQLVRGRDSSILDSDSDLDRIVVQNLHMLDDEARRLLEVVAVFGGPLSAEVAVEVSECVQSEATRADLERRGLLVRASVGGQARLEVAHDRVRENLLVEYPDHERAERHWALGQALRRRCEGEPRGTQLFAIADQLGAGLEVRRTVLQPQERLELAALQSRAGQESLDSAAWEAARRYLRCAHDLLEPWLDDVRAGRGPVELSRAVMFALVRAEHALDPGWGLALAEALMEWELPPLEYSRIVDWFVSCQTEIGALDKAVDTALVGVQRLGLRIPQRISWGRAVWSFLLGWRAMEQSGLLQGKVPSQSIEPQARARTIVLGSVFKLPLFFLSNPRRGLWLLGQHGRLLRYHGAAGVQRQLYTWAMVAMLRGRTEYARAMLHVTEQALEEPETSTSVANETKLFVVFLKGMFDPLRKALPRMREYHEDIRNTAPRSTVETSISTFCGGSFGFMTLSEMSRVLAYMQVHPQGQQTINAQFVAEVWMKVSRCLIDGGPVVFKPSHCSSWDESVRVIASMLYTITAVMLGEFDAAREFEASVSRHRQGFFFGAPFVPLYALACVIVDLEPRSSGHSRGSFWSLRRYKAVARKYTAMCPENFEPMLMGIEAELAAARGRDQDALARYEHAQAAAARHGWHSLSGLVSHRLARLAVRRGRTILARAAFDAAWGAYTAWEAPAVVRVIEAERAAAGLDPALPVGSP